MNCLVQKSRYMEIKSNMTESVHLKSLALSSSGVKRKYDDGSAMFGEISLLNMCWRGPACA